MKQYILVLSIIIFGFICFAQSYVKYEITQKEQKLYTETEKLCDKGYYNKALKKTENFIKENPFSIEGVRVRAEIFARQGDFYRALRDCDLISSKNPLDIRAIHLKGYAYFYIGNNEAAKKNLSDLIFLEEDLVFAYKYRAAVFAKLGRYEEAASDCSKAIELEKDDDESLAALYNDRGLAYFYMNEYSKSLSDYTNSIMLNDKDYSVFHRRALLYKTCKKYNEAFDDLNIALALCPDSSELYLLRGITYRECSEYKKALDDLNLALKLNPDSCTALFQRGYLYCSIKDFKNSNADCTRLEKLYPNTGATYKLKGLIYIEQGKIKEGYSSLKNALAYLPNDEEITSLIKVIEKQLEKN